MALRSRSRQADAHVDLLDAIDIFLVLVSKLKSRSMMPT